MGEIVMWGFVLRVTVLVGILCFRGAVLVGTVRFCGFSAHFLYYKGTKKFTDYQKLASIDCKNVLRN